MTSERVPWVSSQIGINGQFFVPRLLWSMQRLERMLVPLWYDAASPAHRMLSRVYWNAPNFYHPALARPDDRIPSSTCYTVYPISDSLSRNQRITRSSGTWQPIAFCSSDVRSPRLASHLLGSL